MQVDGDDNNYEDDGGGEVRVMMITMADGRKILEAYCFVTTSMRMSAIKYILKITDDDIHYSFAKNCEW